MRYSFLTLLILFGLVMPVQDLSAKRQPAGMLIEVKGKIEYSKKGKKWRKVRRNKFIYDKYFVRVGDGGSVKFLNQETNETTALTPGSEIQVTKKGLKGDQRRFGRNRLRRWVAYGSKGKQFKKTQKYTTVRRSVKKEGIHLKLATNTVTDEFSEVAWQNVGKDYHYKLHIGVKDRKTRKFKPEISYDVPGTEPPLVRVKIDPIKKIKNTWLRSSRARNLYLKQKTETWKHFQRKPKAFEQQREKVRSLRWKRISLCGFVERQWLVGSGIGWIQSVLWRILGWWRHQRTETFSDRSLHTTSSRRDENGRTEKIRGSL